MTQSLDKDDLSQIRKMINLRVNRQSPRSPQPEASDYDWNVPHSFAKHELRAIDEMGVRTTEKLAGAVGSLLSMPLDMELMRVTQHYAERLRMSQPAISGCWTNILDEGGRHIGFVVLSSSKSLAWTSKRLGAVGAASANRKMSSLEVSLVLDIFIAATNAIASAVSASSSVKMQCERSVVEGGLRLPDGSVEEYCMLEYGISGEKETSITLLVLSRVAEALAGLSRHKDSRSAADIKGIMLSHVNRVPITLTIDISEVMVTMRDVVQLAPGDIIPLSVPVNDPISVSYGVKKVLSGWMASNEGNYAIKVAAVASSAKKK